jgi:hypothetical protein
MPVFKASSSSSHPKNSFSVIFNKQRRRNRPNLCFMYFSVTINDRECSKFFRLLLFLAHHIRHPHSFTPFVHLFVFFAELSHKYFFYMLTTVDRKHQPQSSVYLPPSSAIHPFTSRSRMKHLLLNTIEIFCIFPVPSSTSPSFSHTY